LIIVHGVRRVEKTSLIYVGLSELNIPFIPIDVRKFSIYPSYLSPQSLLGVVEEILKRYESYRGRIKDLPRKMLEYVYSLDVKILKLRLREKRRATYQCTRTR